MSMKYFTKPVMAIALLMAGVQASQGDVANVPPGIHVARPPLLNYVLKPNVSDATFEDLFLSATVKNPNSSPQSYTPVFTGLYNRCKEITVVFRGIIFQKGATPCSKHGISLRDYYPSTVME